MTDKTRNFRISLWAVALVLLGLASFFSYCMYLSEKLSPEQVKSRHPQMASAIIWSKSLGGKLMLVALWAMFLLTVLPIGAGEWFRSKQKRYL